jgi:hypothetical protein
MRIKYNLQCLECNEVMTNDLVINHMQKSHNSIGQVKCEDPSEKEGKILKDIWDLVEHDKGHAAPRDAS